MTAVDVTYRQQLEVSKCYMGADRVWQALPSDWHLLNRAMTERDAAETLWYVPSIIKRKCAPLANPPQWEVDLCEECRQLVSQFPGLERRNFDDSGSRSHDIAFWLLSSSRRSGDYRASDLAGKAILGCRSFAGQGDYLRYAPQTEVAEIAAQLQGVEIDQVRGLFDPSAMEGSVYKFWAGDPASEWSRFLEFYDGLKRVYQDAANNGEVIIMRLIT